ncbi:MAG: GtrA family protein [Polyangiaceae bacterium]
MSSRSRSSSPASTSRPAWRACRPAWASAQFVGNKLFAFEDRSKDWMRQGVQFLAVESLGFVANLVLYDLAVTHFQLPVPRSDF